MSGGDLEFIETRRAHVVLTPGSVWKIRKAVRPDGTGTVSVDARRRACEREVALGRALAPGVYRGVVPVTRGVDGRRRLGGEGAPVGWAVHMRRLPDEGRADLRLRAGRLGDDEVRRIAYTLAAWHERAPRDARVADAGRPRALAERIEQAVAPFGEAVSMPPLPEEAQRAARWQRDFLERHAPRFEARVAAGRVRDGHGDLRLEHVFVEEERICVIDRVASDEKLRFVDVCADVALLAVELAEAGRADLGERFLAEYALLANDFDFYPLLDFHASLRASLRGRVEWLRAHLPGADRLDAQERELRARRLLRIACAAAAKPLLPPVVVAVGGKVASGKSTIAARVARAIGAPRIGSDATRDFLLGARLDPAHHEIRWERAYAPDFTQRTYDEVLRRASAVLESGRPVVLDGCFRFAQQRLAARELARRFGHPFLFVEVRVPDALQRERLRARAQRDGVADEAWYAIADELAAQWEPVEELAPAEHLVLDSSRPIEELEARVRERLPTWPDGFAGALGPMPPDTGAPLG